MVTNVMSRVAGHLEVCHFFFFCFFSCPSEERRGEEEKRDEGGGKMRGEDLGKYDKGSGAQ